MKYRTLGNTGLLVSELVIGTVPFGGRGAFEKTGSVDVPLARRMFDMAFDAGVNMVDTADLYSHGLAEEIVGKALAERRPSIILATKARSPMGDNPNDSGASRYHLIRACEASLKRLGTDHIDLYQIHNWDGITPVEETLSALEHLVQSGKVRYFGTSNYTAWQMMKTLGSARLNGWQQPVSQQIYYTPEAREAEYELLPMALDQGIATLVWGPLGEGLLTGKVRRGQQTPPGTRQGNDWPEPYVHDRERAYDIIEALIEVGQRHGCSPARVCLAWLKDRPGITSVITAGRTAEQLHDNLQAAELVLTPKDQAQLEQVTRIAPQYPYWHRIAAQMDRIDPAEAAFIELHRETMKQHKQ
ncbi:aldo/keto reductase [Pseudomonas putida]|uniref:Aldo/keto reductase n=1 Tax=Pseudomonas putida TaxID=303 RepID=A0A7W2L1H4_PSEPU|nr:MULTISPECIES: aldo/keto reductase [Pseudomonas]MBA6116762.1 aldo/keto reductase [Pseudomonas putida]MBI6941882.1 aldo/keto reductase [Pseudomonas putida]MBI6958047.1 aldo/keto reductase [Pseudomonas putida]MCZ9637286.1 aldo/keto reductase [Pseudomonas putida]MEC4877010.1 aldo/keto reductase [Pseudomonas sp. NC26]